jgi:hypothetical protein
MAGVTAVCRCEDCKHWDETAYYRDNGEIPQGDCQLIVYNGIKDRPTTARLTDPGSLWTPADFGCTLWESK